MSRHHPLLALLGLSVLLASPLASQAAPKPAPAPVAAPAATGPGSILGRVVDRGTGRPIADVQVAVVGGAATASDQDGRYRLNGIAPGSYTVRAVRIGYSPVKADSVRVTSGRPTTLDLAMSGATVQLDEVEVVADAEAKSSSAAGLLALQQAAPGASDGVSAELIAKTPDNNAAAAVARVTGVTIVDNKFVYVRGLGERYSNTLLNGVEPVSPEPTRRIVPLDVFPAALLEAIVASKTATPDKPGDFAGGSVDIQTREFPDQFTSSVKVTQEYNSLVTFKDVGLPRLQGGDLFAFDGAGRRVPGVFGNTTLTGLTEGQAERFRQVWTPAARRMAPATGFSGNVGGQIGAGSATPFGYVFAVNYGSDVRRIPDRLFNYGSFVPGNGEYDTVREFTELEVGRTVDWGAIANMAVKLGPNNKIGFKNFYTRNADEQFLQSLGVDEELPTSAPVRTFQVRYIEKSVYQGVLSGQHRLRPGFDLIAEWKASGAIAQRDEPENRRLRYLDATSTSLGFIQTGATSNNFFLTQLRDRAATAQLDLGVPLSLRTTQDALIKIGGFARRKSRRLDPALANLVVQDSVAARLAPEALTAPELIGGTGSTAAAILSGGAGGLVQYDAKDRLYAGYAMLDLYPLPMVRLVGGVRVERWELDFNTVDGNNAPLLYTRRNTDPLWSANATVQLSDRLQFRLAGFRSIARPDPREIALGFYNEVVGSCNFSGDSSVTRTSILNGDARLELYPRPGELLAISGFAKRFTNPIVELISAPSGGCIREATNVPTARLFGGEIEIRKRLDFLGGPFTNLSVNGNLTVVSSRADLRGIREEQFAGQSPYIVNVGLSYDDPASRIRVAVSGNRFGRRIQQYGGISAGGVDGLVFPNIYEEPRTVLDAKADVPIAGGVLLSLQGRNLLDAEYRFRAEIAEFSALSRRFRIGRSFGVGVGYAF